MSVGRYILNLKHLKAVSMLDKGDHYLIEATLRAAFELSRLP